MTCLRRKPLFPRYHLDCDLHHHFTSHECYFFNAEITDFFTIIFKKTAHKGWSHNHYLHPFHQLDALYRKRIRNRILFIALFRMYAYIIARYYHLSTVYCEKRKYIYMFYVYHKCKRMLHAGL